ncbi:MAG: DUF4280 domain-containing protein [Defluviitaleaceae bacterium]|nr:DUF4280 domain-containing protein [Defluviitaleaceae bacterium]
MASSAIGAAREAAATTREAAQIINASDNEYPYVVAGARMFCDKGTHFRRLDLPTCHGAYIRDKAMTNEEDCQHPDNIPIFGVCLSGANPHEDMQYTGSGSEDFLPFENVEFPIIGKRCCPEVGKWLNAKEDVLVDRKPALTANCTCVCRNGGIIGFVDDGQGV